MGQYYQMLQTQPDFVHQFYSDASTMLRIDGNMRETATAMLVFYMTPLIYVQISNSLKFKLNNNWYAHLDTAQQYKYE